MKRKWIRRILGGFSLTSALFIFQACYGTPQDLGLDILIEGQVKAYLSGSPIKGIKVSLPDNVQYGYTDINGNFGFYTEMTDNLRILFEDVDSNQNGTYTSKDTVLTNVGNRIFLNIRLKEK